MVGVVYFGWLFGYVWWLFGSFGYLWLLLRGCGFGGFCCLFGFCGGLGLYRLGLVLVL